MQNGQMSRRALVGAGLISVFGPAVVSPQVHAALPTRQNRTPQFVGHTAVRQAVEQRASGIFNVGDVGSVQTLVLVVNGEPTEVHARRAGVYLPKMPGATSVRVVSPARYNALMQVTGGVDRIALTAQMQQAFTALFNSPETGAAPRAPAAPPAQTCPSDWSTMSPEGQDLIRRNPNSRVYRHYAPCFERTNFPNPLRELFGAPAAHATDDRLVVFEISSNNFFSPWVISYDPTIGAYGFNVFGIRAVWQIGGG